MITTPKKPNIIQISISPSVINTVNSRNPQNPAEKTLNSKPTSKKTFNPFIRQPQVSEISLYDTPSRPEEQSIKKESDYDMIIQSLERKFEGLLIENRQLTEEMNSLSLSDQSSIDLRQIEFVSLESLTGYHRETQSNDLQSNGFMLQKAIEEKAKMEASLIQTVADLKQQKKRLRSELSLKKQEAFHLEKCIKTHKDKKVYEISLRKNDENSWRRRFYELQKALDKRNAEFEEMEKSYQQKIKECYTEMERLRQQRKPDPISVGFNEVERKLIKFDSKMKEMMDYIHELETKLREKESQK